MTSISFTKLQKFSKTQKRDNIFSNTIIWYSNSCKNTSFRGWWQPKNLI